MEWKGSGGERGKKEQEWEEHKPKQRKVFGAYCMKQTLLIFTKYI